MPETPYVSVRETRTEYEVVDVFREYGQSYWEEYSNPKSFVQHFCKQANLEKKRKRLQ